MSCKVCDCGAGLSNTGNGCSPIMKTAKMLIAVPIYDNDGTRNGITLADTLNQAYFDALINQIDVSKRWFPYPQMKNVEDVRGDNKTETFKDQSQLFVSEGIRSFKAWIVGLDATTVIKGKIEAGRCVKMGFFIIDLDGNLIGNISADGLTLYPIRIDENSLAAKFMKSSDDELQKIELTFNFNSTEKDENLKMITCAELGDVQLLDLVGLLDVCATITNITQTGFTATLETEFGSALNKVKDEGLESADFVSSVTAVVSKIRNSTDAADVAITSVTESAPGVYDFVIPSQDIGDTLILKPLKSGREYTCVVDAPFVIPAT